jgi:hypothetical protein
MARCFFDSVLFADFHSISLYPQDLDGTSQVVNYAATFLSRRSPMRRLWSANYKVV